MLNKALLLSLIFTSTCLSANPKYQIQYKIDFDSVQSSNGNSSNTPEENLPVTAKLTMSKDVLFLGDKATIKWEITGKFTYAAIMGDAGYHELTENEKSGEFTYTATNDSWGERLFVNLYVQYLDENGEQQYKESSAIFAKPLDDNCASLLGTMPGLPNGYYDIHPGAWGMTTVVSDQSYRVYCDMTNGGWTRFDDFTITPLEPMGPFTTKKQTFVNNVDLYRMLAQRATSVRFENFKIGHVSADDVGALNLYSGVRGLFIEMGIGTHGDGTLTFSGPLSTPKVGRIWNQLDLKTKNKLWPMETAARLREESVLWELETTTKDIGGATGYTFDSIWFK